MSQLSALYSALVGGQQTPTGGVGSIMSQYRPGMRFTAPAQMATPAQLRAFNQDSDAYRMQAEDEANLARMAAQRGAVPAVQQAIQRPTAGISNPIDAINRALTQGQ